MTRHALAAHAPGRGDLRGQLVRAGGGGQPTAGGAAPDGPGRAALLAGRAARGPRPRRDDRGSGSCAPHDLSPAGARASRPTSGGIRDRTGRTSSATELKAMVAAPAAGPAAAAGRPACCWPVGARGRLRRPGIPPRDGLRARGRPRRAGDRAAVGRPAGVAPVAGRLLAVAGAPGAEQEGRMAGQGGRRPGRQRHRGRRPALPGSTG